MWWPKSVDLALFLNGLKSLLSYRADFWLRSVGALSTEFVIAWALWAAIYVPQEEIHGYSFSELMAFYIVAILSAQVVAGKESHFISEDIYQGHLTRYLIYPLHYLRAKFWEQFSYSAMLAMQLVFVSYVLSLQVDVLVLLSFMAGFLMYFVLLIFLESFAFWLDHVWSLTAMLRFGGRFLSGIVLPLSMFPHEIATVLRKLPFYMFGGVQAELMTGRLSAEQFWHLLAWQVFWFVSIGLLASATWRRGQYQYTGVGI